MIRWNNDKLELTDEAKKVTLFKNNWKINKYQTNEN